MKNRIAYYLKPNEEQEKILKFRIENKREDVACLEKKYFDKQTDKDKLAGYVHQRNKRYSGKEYGTLFNVSEYNLDVYSKKKFYQHVTGYIQTTDGEYIAVTSSRLLIIPFIMGIILAGICIFFLLNQPVVPAPDFSDIADEDKNNKYDIVARVGLPDGNVSFDGKVYTYEDEKKKQDQKKGEYEEYSGDATITVVITIDGAEHVLLEKTRVKIKNGELPDVTINFSKLDFELKPGIYKGKVHIVYADGSEIDKPIEIVIIDSDSGKAGIGFSKRVDVYKNQNKIKMKYEYEEATTDAIVQIIAMRNDKEILLGQSGIIKRGQKLEEVDLDKSAKSKIDEGAYEGMMRVYFDDAGANESTNLKVDIECKIYVQ